MVQVHILKPDTRLGAVSSKHIMWRANTSCGEQLRPPKHAIRGPGGPQIGGTAKVPRHAGRFDQGPLFRFGSPTHARTRMQRRRPHPPHSRAAKGRAASSAAVGRARSTMLCYSSVRHNGAQYNAAQRSSASPHTTLHHTTLHNTTLHCITPRHTPHHAAASRDEAL